MAVELAVTFGVLLAFTVLALLVVHDQKQRAEAEAESERDMRFRLIGEMHDRSRSEYEKKRAMRHALRDLVDEAESILYGVRSTSTTVLGNEHLYFREGTLMQAVGYAKKVLNGRGGKCDG